jgi:uncharacterized protein related to proFAR isomerase
MRGGWGRGLVVFRRGGGDLEMEKTFTIHRDGVDASCVGRVIQEGDGGQLDV